VRQTTNKLLTKWQQRVENWRADKWPFGPAQEKGALFCCADKWGESRVVDSIRMIIFRAVNGFTFLGAVRGLWFLGPVLAVFFVLSGCDRKATEPESEEAAVVEDKAPEVVEILEVGQEEAEPSAVLIESAVEPMSPETVPGRYRDPSAPEVLYEFREDNTWSATWQPDDETRGLMMEGVYQVESGGVVHLRVLAFGRREAFIGDDWDKRTPPHPRPRAFFRIDGSSLMMMSDKTAQAFTMAPFNASRLVKVE
jgi:hypothetical protein